MRILAHALSGRPIARFPGIADGDRAREVQEFCADLRDFYQGDGSGIDDRASVERIPYTFDFTRLPILGEIAITYACNNACRFCYAGCGSKGCGPGAAPGAAAPPMKLAEAKQVIDVFVRDAQIPFFSFTGGEPTLHPDLPAIIRHADDLGLIVGMNTNGRLLSHAPTMAALAEAGLNHVQITLESDQPEVHNAMTGADSFLLKVIVTNVSHLESLLDLLSKYGQPVTSIVLSVPIDYRPIQKWHDGEESL